MKMIYLDYAATTPLDSAVATVMHRVEAQFFANPSSIHSAGQQSKVQLEQARQIVATALNAKPDEIVFTSGGTESNNMAIIGTALANRHLGNHIITTKIEHPAVLEPCHYLEQNGFRVSYLDVDRNGMPDLNQLKTLLCPDTILVSVMAVNNETGVILPLDQVQSLLKDTSALLHSDAVQAFGKIQIPGSVDLLSLSAHKIYGPKGIGALYIRKGSRVNPILYGGSQEVHHRPGTENLPAICGFAEAVSRLQHFTVHADRIRGLRDMFEQRVTDLIPGVEINGAGTSRAGEYSNIYFPFMAGDSLLMNLDMHGVAVSSGSACSSGSRKPSHVLDSMGFSGEHVNNSLRFSLGRSTSEEDILKTVDIISMLYKRLKK
ncbi:MAG: cysteine desulfurase [Calditrichales bacterium]|nr:MAG: cysteine desulfurase [Calditrichales bacterium]